MRSALSSGHHSQWTHPRWIAVADVNHDHNPDIVVANAGSDSNDSGSITVLLGDGRGGFRPASGSPVPAGHLPNDIAIADMNNDSNLDLVIANHQSPYLRVLLGDGRGGFHLAHGSPVGDPQPRLGMWPQDIAANLDSVNASELAAKQHLDGVAHELHAYEFLLYAYLQDGDDAHAKKIYESTDSVIRHLAAIPGIENDGMYMFTSYMQVEFPSIYHLERHEWGEVLAIPEPPHPLVSSTYFRDWAQAIAAGHLHNSAAAGDAVTRAQSIYKQVEAEGSPISAEIHVTFLTMQAWQSYAHGRDAEALAKLSSAADEQDRVGQAEVDVPAREMYADMLLAEGHPAEALTQYKVALKLSPNRFDGLANAARAAEACGQMDDARFYYRELLQVTNNGQASERPEIAQAHAFLKGAKEPVDAR